MYCFDQQVFWVTVCRMEEMVRDMMQYKIKIDQLKQEKASLAVTYEVSSKRFCGQLLCLKS